MSMRTREEIQEVVLRLKAEIPHIPSHSAFGDDNHKLQNLIIEAVENSWDWDDVYEQGLDSEEENNLSEAIEWNNGADNLDDVFWFDDDKRDQEAPEETLTPSLILAEPKERSKVDICYKTCKDCPFSRGSLRGFLADYTIEDFAKFQQVEMNFPCHKHMVDGSLSAAETHIRVKDGEMPFCRGYVESFVKSGIKPKKNKRLMEAIELVKEQGLSENTMSIHEFRKFHDIKEAYGNKKDKNTKL